MTEAPLPSGSENGVSDELRSAVLSWVAGDPDEASCRELLSLLEEGDVAELADRFGAALTFGTAGLRGVLGAGPNRMNRAVVIRTTAGLGAHLLRAIPNAAERGVVVGHDARHGSRTFALDAMAVLAALGIRVHGFGSCVPTPLVAFAVRHLGAAGGIVITASHNPAAYNGYKIYWENGAQIAPPSDERIAAAIAQVPAARLVPRQPLEEASATGRLTWLSADLFDTYYAGVRALCRRPEIRPPLAIVYTAVHGVGFASVVSAFRRTGFGDLIPVPDQVEPNPSFPTAPFPNPEEAGVLDRAIHLAERVGADLVLANDPDADRLAAAVPRPEGGFVQLTGNQIGVLLGHFLLETGAPSNDSRRASLLVSTIASSPMLREICDDYGARYETTLTGFKWMENRAFELERDANLRLVFAYEEALGYSVGGLVRDKDGISAAVLFAEIAAVCRQQGTSIFERLEALYRRYGLHASRQSNIHATGPRALTDIAQMVQRVRSDLPQSLAGRPVLLTSDYLAGQLWDRAGTMRPTGLPPSNVLSFELEGGSRVIIRPSGTEPKLKVYLDHREAVDLQESIRAAQGRADEAIALLEKDVLARLGAGEYNR